MFRIINAVLLSLLFSVNLFADDLLIRPTVECCGSAQEFPPGTRVALLANGYVVAMADTTSRSAIKFKDLKAGVYDLVVQVGGYYPAKFINVEIDSSTWDFELISTFRSLKATVIEGQAEVRFRPGLKNQDIKNKLDGWRVKSMPTAPPDERSKLIEFYATPGKDDVRVRIVTDGESQLDGVIYRILLDSDVLSCTPSFLSF